MKAIKRLAWGLPTVALAVGAFALTGGMTGAMTGPDLPAPIEAVAAAETEAPAGVDGESWELMATKAKKSAKTTVRNVRAQQVVYKGSARGF